MYRQTSGRTSYPTIRRLAVACALALLAIAPLPAGTAIAEETNAGAPAQQQAQAQAQAQTQGDPVFAEADSAALLDKAGNVLFEHNGTKQEHPASTTKVMTAMVALDSKRDLSEIVEIKVPDLGDNSQMGDYGNGDRVPLGELLRVMLVYSANDAAWNVATHVAGSEAAFVDLMNKKAAELGLKHTHFTNSHGLEDDDHYTCALDLAEIGRYALEHYPFIGQTALLHTVDTTVHGDAITLNSTDRLLDTYDGIRGLKTGAIVANYTFLGASGRGEVQLYTAVLGCASFMGRFDDAAMLMDWGYDRYQQRPLTREGWIVAANPYAYNPGMKTYVRSTANCDVRDWPSLGGFSYSTTQSKPHRLLDSQTECGWTTWSQSNANMGTALYASDPTPRFASSWPIFSAPLFENA